MAKESQNLIQFDADRVNVIRGKSLMLPDDIGEDIRCLCRMLDWFESELDQLDYDDELGTEGWRHRFGIDD